MKVQMLQKSPINSQKSSKTLQLKLTSDVTLSPFKKKKVGTLLTRKAPAISGNSSMSILTKVTVA